MEPNNEIAKVTVRQARLAMIVLLLIYAVILLTYVNDFYVPDSDFFDFRDKAIAFRNLELPNNIKRPPLYSLLLALASTAIPGQFRELYAAEFINVISAIGVVLMTFLVAKRFIGSHAILIAWLVAVNPLAIKMAVKPKAEMLAAFLILSAFWLFLKQSRRAYLLVFLASMARFEGVLMAPGFVAHDFIVRKQRWRSILFGALAVSFSLIWFFLARGSDSESTGYQSYFNTGQVLQGFYFINSLFGSLVGFLPMKLFRIWSGVTAVLVLVGIYTCFRKNPAITLALGLYFILFLMLHFIWPFSIQDYMIMINWACYIFIFAGLVFLVQKLPLASIGSHWQHSRFLRMLLPALVCLLWAWLMIRPEPIAPNRPKIWLVGLFVIPVILHLWQLSRDKGIARLPIIILALFPVTMIAWSSNVLTNTTMFDLRYAKAEFRQVGEWYQKNYRPGDKLFMLQPYIAAFYTELSLETDFVSQAEADADSLPELVNWLNKRNVTYVVWVSHQKKRDSNDAWYQWRVNNRNLLLLDDLSRGTSLENFELVHEIRLGPRWAYIYRVRKSA